MLEDTNPPDPQQPGSDYDWGATSSPTSPENPVNTAARLDPHRAFQSGQLVRDPSVWDYTKDLALSTTVRPLYNTFRDAYSLVDHIGFDLLPDLPHWESNTTAGAVVSDLFQIMAGFATGSAALEGLGIAGKLSKLGLLGKLGLTAAEGVAGSVFFENHANLSNLLKDHHIGGALTDFLAVGPDDSDATARLKGALEGIGLGPIISPILKTFGFIAKEGYLQLGKVIPPLKTIGEFGKSLRETLHLSRNKAVEEIIPFETGQAKSVIEKTGLDLKELQLDFPGGETDFHVPADFTPADQQRVTKNFLDAQAEKTPPQFSKVEPTDIPTKPQQFTGSSEIQQDFTDSLEKANGLQQGQSADSSQLPKLIDNRQALTNLRDKVRNSPLDLFSGSTPQSTIAISKAYESLYKHTIEKTLSSGGSYDAEVTQAWKYLVDTLNLTPAKQATYLMRLGLLTSNSEIDMVAKMMSAADLVHNAVTSLKGDLTSIPDFGFLAEQDPLKFVALAKKLEVTGQLGEHAAGKVDPVSQNVVSRSVPNPKASQSVIEPLQASGSAKGSIASPESGGPISLPIRPTPGNNTVQPLSRYSAKLYRETSINRVGEFIPNSGTEVGPGMSDGYFANTKELALGQGANKGVVLEFKSNNLQGKINTAKPGWEVAYDNGMVEFLAQHNEQTAYQDALIGITIKPDAKGNIGYKKALQKNLQDLEKNGWRKSTLSDGSIHYSKPDEISPESGGPIKAPIASDPFKTLAQAQRDIPESAMLKIQDAQISQLYGNLAEHTGDLTHRMSENMAIGSGGGGPAKIKNMLHLLTPSSDRMPIFDDIKKQIKSNLKYYQEKGQLLNETFESQFAKLKELGKTYADAHKALPVFNEAQTVARDAAVAIGEFRFKDAQKLLEKLQGWIDDGSWTKRVKDNPTSTSTAPTGLMTNEEFLVKGGKPKGKTPRTSKPLTTEQASNTDFNFGYNNSSNPPLEDTTTMHTGLNITPELRKKVVDTWEETKAYIQARGGKKVISDILTFTREDIEKYGAAFLSHITPDKTGSYFGVASEIQISSLLSGTLLQQINAANNLGMAFTLPLIRLGGGLTRAATGAITHTPALTQEGMFAVQNALLTIKHMTLGYLDSVGLFSGNGLKSGRYGGTTAVESFMDVLKHGDSKFLGPADPTKIEFTHQLTSDKIANLWGLNYILNPLSKILPVAVNRGAAKAVDFAGMVVQAPLRLIKAADVFAKVLNVRAYAMASFDQEATKLIQAGKLEPELASLYSVDRMNNLIKNGEFLNKDRIFREGLDKATQKYNVTSEQMLANPELLAGETTQYAHQTYEPQDAGIARQSLVKADEATFTTPTGELTNLGKSLVRIVPPLKLFMPMLGTASNILKANIQGILGIDQAVGLAQIAKATWEARIANVGRDVMDVGLPATQKRFSRFAREITSDDPLIKADAMGRAVLAGGALITLSHLANNIYNKYSTIRIVGSGPHDPVENALWSKMHTADSLEIGPYGKPTTTIPLAKLDYLGASLKVIADFWQWSHFATEKEQKNVNATFGGLWTAFTQDLFHESYGRNLIDLTRAAGDNDINLLNRIVNTIGSSFVPNLLRDSIPMFNGPSADILKEHQTFIDSMIAKTPWGASKLFPRLTVLGEPMERIPAWGEDSLGRWSAVWNPIQVRHPKEDPLSNELVRLNQHWPTTEKTITNGGITVDLTQFKNANGETAAHRWQFLSGKQNLGKGNMRAELTQTINSPEYKTLPQFTPDENINNLQAAKISAIMSAHQLKAREQMLSEFPEIKAQFLGKKHLLENLKQNYNRKLGR